MDISLILTIVTGFCIGLTAIICLICTLLGIKRGVFNGGLRIAFVVLSVIISFFVAKGVAGVLASEFSKVIQDAINNDIMKLDSVTVLLLKIAKGLAAPLCFVIIFFVVDKIMLIPYSIIKKILKKRQILVNNSWNKPVGAAMGLVLGLVISAVFLLPLSGYTTYMVKTLDRVSTTSFAKEFPKEINEIASSLKKAPVIQVTHAATGFIFNGLSSDLNVATDSLVAIVKTADMMSSITGSDSGNEGNEGDEGNEGGTPVTPPDITEIDMGKVLEELTPESAAIVSDVIKDAVSTLIPENIEGGESLKAMVECVADVIAVLPEAKKEMSDEEYKAEVDAMNSLFQVVNEESDVKPSEIIETVLDSKIMSETVSKMSDDITEVIKDQYIVVPDEDRDEIVDVLTSQFTQNIENEAALDVFAAIFNIDQSEYKTNN